MSTLDGRNILIVEDSPVVAPFTAELLGELGCVVVGPAPNIATARELIETAKIDAAIMDINIRGERVFPMCELLEARGIPFVLTSGYSGLAVPPKWADRPRLPKPYAIADVEAALAKLFED
ncbi:response regulator [Sphingomonas lutea]|uniref:Response regulator n=1 Tax=Sphingomonas lutea TaxID=1045317 RepID=A0A7G9SIY2_9SPHN|nr:response regulator [Sphingomonas lutea]QNN67807.1 response regulator [Sphingomonas lutea]